MFSSSVVSNFLWPHELQHAMLPWPSPSPGAWSNSHPLSQWCHPTISSSVAPFPCLQSFPGSGSFPVSHLFTSGGHSTGTSASSPSNEYSELFILGLIGLISMQSNGVSKVFTRTTVQRHQFFSAQPFLLSSSHIYTWLLEKPQLWLYGPLLAQWCLFYLYLVCFTFCISYSVLPFHLVYVFQFLHLFWVVFWTFFLKCSRKAFVYLYINNMYNIYILEILGIFT